MRGAQVRPNTHLTVIGRRSRAGGGYGNHVVDKEASPHSARTAILFPGTHPLPCLRVPWVCAVRSQCALHFLIPHVFALFCARSRFPHSAVPAATPRPPIMFHCARAKKGNGGVERSPVAPQPARAAHSFHASAHDYPAPLWQEVIDHSCRTPSHHEPSGSEPWQSTNTQHPVYWSMGPSMAARYAHRWHTRQYASSMLRVAWSGLRP